jgi:DNA gyrase subunit A
MAGRKGATERPEGGVVDGDLRTMFEEKYAEFAVSSNARAIPDVRDGMKPVHRRILYGISETAPAGGPTKKCAKIVGDIMGEH